LRRKENCAVRKRSGKLTVIPVIGVGIGIGVLVAGQGKKGRGREREREREGGREGGEQMVAFGRFLTGF